MRIAAPPTSKSRVSWSPAVPPPPAAGGPEGTGLAEAEVVAVGGVVKTDDDGVVLALWLALAVRLAWGLELGLALVLVLARLLVLVPLLGLVVVLAGAVALVVPVVPVAGSEPDTVGMVGVEVEPPEHADTAVAVRTVSAPTPISRALSVNPAMVVRSLIEPPCAAICDGSFPSSGFTNPHGKKYSAVDLDPGRRQFSEIADDDKGKARRRRGRAIARSSFEY
jgi:hypothetical protein